MFVKNVLKCFFLLCLMTASTASADCRIPSTVEVGATYKIAFTTGKSIAEILVTKLDRKDCWIIIQFPSDRSEVAINPSTIMAIQQINTPEEKAALDA